MGGGIRTRYVAANVTTPAGTTAAAPQSTLVTLGDLILLAVHLLIPAGHAGLTGWRLDYSGTTLIPFSNPPAWVIGNDDHHDFDVDYEVGNTLRIVTYNTDAYDHTHYAMMKVRDLDNAQAGMVQLMTILPAG